MSNTNSNLLASSNSASCAANSARVLNGRLLLSSVNKYKTSNAARSFSAAVFNQFLKISLDEFVGPIWLIFF